MKFKVVKRVALDVPSPGPRSDLSGVLAQLKSLRPDDAVVIVTPKDQRLVYNRMRANVAKWKRRKGLTHVSVHLTEDGNVAIFYSPKK